MIDKTQRLWSLDAFRGIAIAGMILVNNPGSWSHVYPPLLHSEWHGWTPTDLIFPFFLFIMGVAMTFSFFRHFRKSGSKRALYFKIIRRTVILFALGLFLNGFPYYNFSTLRIPGVLQRIAVVYLFASLIILNTGVRGQITFTAVILLIYWAVMKLVPVPGYGAGNLSVEGNLAAYIDYHLFKGHMWKATWDPEGLLSTIPAIATTLTGVLTGYWLHSGRQKAEIAGWMFVVGWFAILTGLFWNIWFPINKNLWTSSYVLFTSGAALQFLGVCYWLIEVKGYRKWAIPAIIYGLNSIAVFVASGIIVRLMLLIKVHDPDRVVSLKTWIYQHGFASWLGPLNGSLAFAMANILFWLGIMYLLYRKNIFIKI